MVETLCLLLLSTQLLAADPPAASAPRPPVAPTAHPPTPPIDPSAADEEPEAPAAASDKAAGDKSATLNATANRTEDNAETRTGATNEAGATKVTGAKPTKAVAREIEPEKAKPAAGHDGASTKRPEAGAAAPANGGADGSDNPANHSLSRRTLGTELERASKERAKERTKLEEERQGLAAERKRLEKLAQEIAEARDALKAETERLEGSLAMRRGAPAGSKSEGKKVELGGVAQAVKSMKPDQAAVLIAKLNPRLGAKLLARMRPNDAGAVMEKLKPDLAAELIAEMVAQAGPAKKGAR